MYFRRQLRAQRLKNKLRWYDFFEIAEELRQKIRRSCGFLSLQDGHFPTAKLRMHARQTSTGPPGRSHAAPSGRALRSVSGITEPAPLAAVAF